MRNSFLKDMPEGQERKDLPAVSYLEYLKTLSAGENSRETEQTIAFIRLMRKEIEDAALENKQVAFINTSFNDDNNPAEHPHVAQAIDYFQKQGLQVESFPAKFRTIKHKDGEKTEKVNGPYIRISWKD